MRTKHIPQRTCIVCQQVRAKKELVRVIRNPEGRVEIDSTGKKAGRGAYLCPNKKCWEVALKRKSIERALEIVLTADERTLIQDYGGRFPATDSGASLTGSTPVAGVSSTSSHRGGICE